MSEINWDPPALIEAREPKQSKQHFKIKRLARAALHPIETFRTAPLSVYCGGLSTALCVGVAAEAVKHPSPWEAATGTTFAVLAGVSGKVMDRQLDIRDRVRQNVDEHGFDERYFEPLTDEWCARQTVHVALEGTKFLDNFKELCELRSETAEFSELPHF